MPDHVRLLRGGIGERLAPSPESSPGGTAQASQGTVPGPLRRLVVAASLVFLIYPVVSVARGSAGSTERVVPASIITAVTVAIYMAVADGVSASWCRRGVWAGLVEMMAAGVVVPVIYGPTWLGLSLYAVIAASLALPIGGGLTATAGVTGATVVVGVIIGAPAGVVLSVSLTTALTGAGICALAWILATNQALRSAQSEIARLAADEERFRLSRELHDAVKQQAFIAAMELGAARGALATDAGPAARHLARADVAIRQVQRELSGLVDELRDTGAPVDLANRLGDYLTAWSERHAIEADLHTIGTAACSPEVEDALFMATTEALTNVARHSTASRVEVTLEQGRDEIVVTITDNGHGFVPSPGRGGSGLAIIDERLAALGGGSSVVSTPGCGAQITLRWPRTPTNLEAR